MYVAAYNKWHKETSSLVLRMHILVHSLPLVLGRDGSLRTLERLLRIEGIIQNSTKPKCPIDNNSIIHILSYIARQQTFNPLYREKKENETHEMDSAPQSESYIKQ